MPLFEQLPTWQEVLPIIGLFAAGASLLGLAAGLIVGYFRRLSLPWGSSPNRLVAGVLSLVAAAACGWLLYQHVENYAARIGASVGAVVQVPGFLAAGLAASRSR